MPGAPPLLTHGVHVFVLEATQHQFAPTCKDFGVRRVARPGAPTDNWFLNPREGTVNHSKAAEWNMREGGRPLHTAKELRTGSSKWASNRYMMMMTPLCRNDAS